MSSEFLANEINLICLALLFMLTGKLRHTHIMAEKRFFFYLAAVLNMILIFIEIIYGFVNGATGNFMRNMNWTINMLYYIISSCMCFAWYLYSENMLKETSHRKKIHYWPEALPVLVVILLTLTTRFTNLMFYIDEADFYCRGRMFFLQTMINFGYLLYASIHALYLSEIAKTYREKIEGRALSMAVIPVVLFGCTQIVWPEAPALCIGCTLSLVYIYLTLQEQAISMDSLTGLNNRITLYSYLNDLARHPRNGKKEWILLLDVDRFKFINDNFGHFEGDNALKVISDCLQKSCTGAGNFISRYGGDEFVIVHETEEKGNPDLFCRKIREKLQETDLPYDLSVSIGLAEYNGNPMDLPEILATADTNMYIDKLSRKPS